MVSNYDQLIRNSYAGVGKTGITPEISNNTIDQGGYDYWNNQLSSGNLTEENFGQAFTNSAQDYNANNPIQPQNIENPGTSNTRVPKWINELSKGIPNYFNAYKELKGLPDKIDNWTQNSINRQRATGDQVSNIFNRIGNQRAGSGIMGGTEYDNANATMMTNLAKIFEENQGNIEMNANTMKAQAISSMPAQAMMPVNAMTSLYGVNAGDQANWANLAAQMLNSGY